jgi:polyhydroxybutyrate depolymerase
MTGFIASVQAARACKWGSALAIVGGLLVAASPAAAKSGSSGCGQPFATGQKTTLTVSSEGRQRVAIVYVPTGYDRRKPLPVVLDLHGSQSNAAEQMVRSELSDSAERNTFITVAPQGWLPAPPGFRWNVPGVTTTDPSAPDDEQFLSDLIDQLQATLCIDERRVYGAGYSGGARMISQYACDHPERLAAIAAVSGLRAGVPVAGPQGWQPDPATCSPRRQVPVITFQGTADPVNPYLGGGAPYWRYGVPAAQARWAEINNCHQGPRTRPVSEHVDQVAYVACPHDAQVVMYLIENGGHVWPSSEAFVGLGLGEVTFEIDANALIWRFLQHYKLPN